MKLSYMPGFTTTVIKKRKLRSTQQYLLKLIQKKTVSEGTLIITNHQYAGIGQPENTWESLPGKNLTFSVLLKPSFIDPADQFLITKMISLSILEYLSSIHELNKKLSIKWPNDIYAGDRKIGGILITNAVMGNKIEYSVIGIGLNINQAVFTPYCPNPTSLFLETGKQHILNEVFTGVTNTIKEYYRLAQYNSEFLHSKYLDVLYQNGQRKSYLIRGVQCSAIICGVNEYGQLLLDIEGKGTNCFDLKEVVYL
jgi:BirA family biotin operon repressor/biotin-[acetyl-CoA-carboxylase] ligase